MSELAARTTRRGFRTFGVGEAPAPPQRWRQTHKRGAIKRASSASVPATSSVTAPRITWVSQKTTGSSAAYPGMAPAAERTHREEHGTCPVIHASDRFAASPAASAGRSTSSTLASELPPATLAWPTDAPAAPAPRRTATGRPPTGRCMCARRAKSFQEVVEALTSNTQERTSSVTLVFERPR